VLISCHLSTFWQDSLDSLIRKIESLLASRRDDWDPQTDELSDELAKLELNHYANYLSVRSSGEKG
jgi:hypothetical protein